MFIKEGSLSKGQIFVFLGALKLYRAVCVERKERIKIFFEKMLILATF